MPQNGGQPPTPPPKKTNHPFVEMNPPEKDGTRPEEDASTNTAAKDSVRGQSPLGTSDPFGGKDEGDRKKKKPGKKNSQVAEAILPKKGIAPAPKHPSFRSKTLQPHRPRSHGSSSRGRGIVGRAIDSVLKNRAEKKDFEEKKDLATHQAELRMKVAEYKVRPVSSMNEGNLRSIIGHVLKRRSANQAMERRKDLASHNAELRIKVAQHAAQLKANKQSTSPVTSSTDKLRASLEAHAKERRKRSGALLRPTAPKSPNTFDWSKSNKGDSMRHPSGGNPTWGTKDYVERDPRRENEPAQPPKARRRSMGWRKPTTSAPPAMAGKLREDTTMPKIAEDMASDLDRWRKEGKAKRGSIKTTGRGGALGKWRKERNREVYGEETEQIDEISKKLLASYAKKATQDVEAKSRDLVHAGDHYWQSLRKVKKRVKGHSKAIDKLAKEETEPPKKLVVDVTIPNSRQTVRKTFESAREARTFYLNRLRNGEKMTLAETVCLIRKAQASGIAYDIIKEVYARGIDDWIAGDVLDHSPQQWSFNRVNSFIAGGKARELDKDLLDE